MHIPVLLQQFLECFKPVPIRYFLDGTVGAGNHAAALLQDHPEIEILFGLDQDPDALAIAAETLKEFKKQVVLIHGNFKDFKTLIPGHQFDGIFLDLGVSSMQLDRREKGFSLYHEGPLDMRMDPSNKLTAAEVVNSFSEPKLGEIFREYGEEPRWRQAAKAVVEARKKKRLITTTDLGFALKHVLTWGGRGRKKIHPLTLVFQALRIYVNHELENLEIVLPEAVKHLNSGGRLCVISFHSLEDRIVKQTFRNISKENERVQILTKKPIVPEFNESRSNPRSRSSKLRAVTRL